MNENPLRSLTAANVVVVAGKGGVGKTTVTAVIARAAARSGRRVLVIELDGKPTLEELLPERGDEDITVVHLSAPDALEEYINDHGFRRIAKRLNRTGVIDMVGTAAPGIDDIVVLGKVKQYERSHEYGAPVEVSHITSRRNSSFYLVSLLTARLLKQETPAADTCVGISTEEGEITRPRVVFYVHTRRTEN